MKQIKLYLTIMILLSSCDIFTINVNNIKQLQEKDYSYVSEDLFRSLCNVKNFRFNPSDINDGDIIYVSNQKPHLDHFFKNLHPKIRSKYILISHGALCHNVEVYKKYLNDENIIAWFGKNLTLNHKKAFLIPIGIPPRYVTKKKYTLFKKIISKLPIKKDILLYMNFRLETNKIRETIWDIFSQKSYCYKTDNKCFENYLEEMARSQFILSPEGSGSDCHRTWEAMLVGSIPIVTSSKINPLFAELPVLVIDNWNEITEEFLHKKYNEITTKTYNMEKLWIYYWLNKIKKVKEEALRN